jgi:hypothetical protein
MAQTTGETSRGDLQHITGQLDFWLSVDVVVVRQFRLTQR